MNLSSFVGNRLSLKRDSRRSSAGVVIAVSGIAVSFIVMLLAIAVVTGFKKEITDKLTGFNAQITVLPASTGPDTANQGPIHYSDNLHRAISKIVPDAEISLAINQPAVFKTDSAFQGVILRGMDPNGAWNFVEENMTAATEKEGLVISRHTADALGIKAGEKLMTHFFDGSHIRSRNIPVKGIYESHFSDFDNSIAFIPISELQEIFDVDSMTATSLEIRGIGNNDLDKISESLYQALLAYSAENLEDGGSPAQFYRVENLNTQCSIYINWLNLLDANVVVILVLMILVSCFTLISSLFIIILERVNMIGLFKAMGATNLQIRRIFIYMAQRLVVRGLLIGNIIGLGIIFLQLKFRLFPLDAEAYYLSFVPMNISWLTIILLNIGVIVMTWLILILPSLLISTLSPARSIRYE